jgi:hypothetical protein
MADARQMAWRYTQGFCIIGKSPRLAQMLGKQGLKLHKARVCLRAFRHISGIKAAQHNACQLHRLRAQHQSAEQMSGGMFRGNRLKYSYYFVSYG